jgi:hypothetical protein
LLAIAGLIWLLGWPVQWALQGILWLANRLLHAIAQVLSHRRLYKLLLALTLASTVLAFFLPNELRCP